MTTTQSRRVFWIVVSAHCFLWVLLPGLLHDAYKPDIIEQLFIGREWVPASARHPALPAILLEIVNLMTGRAFFSPFLVSQLCVLATMWGIWKMGRRVLSPTLSLIPPFSMLLFWFFTIESTKYNQNLPYIAFWTLSIYFVYESLRNNRLGNWLAAGVCIGLGMNSKYSMILLVVAFLAFCLYDARARKTWKSFGPYLTTLVAILIFSPQIYWMIARQGLIAPEYIEHPDPMPFFDRFYMVARFFLAQAGVLIFPLLAMLIVLRHPMKKRRDLDEEQSYAARFLGAMILLPTLLHALIGLAVLEDMNADYGAPLWPMLGIWILLYFQPNINGQTLSEESAKDFSVDDSKSGRLKTMGVFAAFVFLFEAIFVIVFVIQAIYSPQILGKPRRFHFPMQDLGAAVERIWSERIDGPCPYLTGEWWIAGNAAQGMNPIPTVHAIGNFETMDDNDAPTSWSSDADVNHRGGIVLWELDEKGLSVPKTLLDHFPGAVVLEPLTIEYKKYKNAEPLKIGVAIIPPESAEPERLETPH